MTPPRRSRAPRVPVSAGTPTSPSPFIPTHPPHRQPLPNPHRPLTVTHAHDDLGLPSAARSDRARWNRERWRRRRLLLRPGLARLGAARPGAGSRRPTRTCPTARTAGARARRRRSSAPGAAATRTSTAATCARSSGRRSPRPSTRAAAPTAAHRHAVQEPRRHAQEEVQGRARPRRALRLELLRQAPQAWAGQAQAVVGWPPSPPRRLRPPAARPRPAKGMEARELEVGHGQRHCSAFLFLN
jgi:hypothetical protein